MNKDIISVIVKFCDIFTLAAFVNVSAEFRKYALAEIAKRKAIDEAVSAAENEKFANIHRMEFLAILARDLKMAANLMSECRRYYCVDIQTQFDYLCSDCRKLFASRFCEFEFADINYFDCDIKRLANCLFAGKSLAVDDNYAKNMRRFHEYVIWCGRQPQINLPFIPQFKPVKSKYIFENNDFARELSEKYGEDVSKYFRLK